MKDHFDFEMYLKIASDGRQQMEILMKADENLARAAMKLLSSITASRVN